jgi:hypothetical protein
MKTILLFLALCGFVGVAVSAKPPKPIRPQFEIRYTEPTDAAVVASDDYYDGECYSVLKFKAATVVFSGDDFLATCYLQTYSNPIFLTPQMRGFSYWSIGDDARLTPINVSCHVEGNYSVVLE